MWKTSGASSPICGGLGPYLTGMETLAGMRKEGIIRDLESSTQRFSEALQALPAAQFHRKPEQGGWSAAEVAEHLVATETGINKALRKAAPCQRLADEKMEMIRRGMGDGERRYPAPDMLLPTNGQYTAEQLLAAFQAQREVTRQLIQDTDITELVEFPHPYFGQMTRMEWVYFNIHHTDRHIGQMKRLST